MVSSNPNCKSRNKLTAEKTHRGRKVFLFTLRVRWFLTPERLDMYMEGCSVIGEEARPRTLCTRVFDDGFFSLALLSATTRVRTLGIVVGGLKQRRKGVRRL